MKNLLYTFKIRNKEGEVYSSVIMDSYEHALYVISRLLEEGYYKIKAPAELISLEVIDYEC